MAPVMGTTIATPSAVMAPARIPPSGTLPGPGASGMPVTEPPDCAGAGSAATSSPSTVTRACARSLSSPQAAIASTRRQGSNRKRVMAEAYGRTTDDDTQRR